MLRTKGRGGHEAWRASHLADATACRVIAGPVEATALGNIVMQMVASGAVDSVAAGREIVARSFPAQLFEPEDTGAWDDAYKRFRQYVQSVKSASP